MLSRQKGNASSSGFRHVSRPLGPDEHLPRLPTLLEQVLACRFEAQQSEAEGAAGDEAWQDDEEDAGEA
jgi:hypothetical protein